MSISSSTGPTTASPAGSAQDGGVKAQAESALGTAKQEVASVAQSAGDHAKSLFGSATSELKDQSKVQTEKIGQSLAQISDELKSMADNSPESGLVTSTVRSLAETTAGVARRLEDGGPEGLMSDVSGFGRRHPLSFLAAAALGGFVTARVIRSTDNSSLKAAIEPSSGSDGNESSGGQQASGDPMMDTLASGLAAGGSPAGGTAMGGASPADVPGVPSAVAP